MHDEHQPGDSKEEPHSRLHAHEAIEQVREWREGK